MKRLFVKPEYRKLKLGEKLVSEIINHAKQKGYKEMVLDTIEPLKAAIHLYKNFQFYQTGFFLNCRINQHGLHPRQLKFLHLNFFYNFSRVADCYCVFGN